MESTSKESEKVEGESPEVGTPQKANLETVVDAPPAYSSISSIFGLEQLAAIKRVNVQHKDVTTEQGEVIFTLKRELMKIGMTYKWSFDLYDKTERKVIMLKPIRSICNGRLEVYVEGVLASLLRVKIFPCICSPSYHITDADYNKVLKIKAPHAFQRHFVVTLKDMQGQHVGNITKKWNGLADELFADANVFEIDFPTELEVPYKAAVIGFCTLIAQSAALQHRTEN